MQFKRSYKRNDKTIMGATLKFLAHLTNQGVVNEILMMEIIIQLLQLENLTGMCMQSPASAFPSECNEACHLAE